MPGESTDRAALYVSIVNMLITLAAAVGGYFMVTRVQQSVDAAHLQIDQTKSIIDTAKFLNDLRPNVDLRCVANQEAATVVRVSCLQKNIGAQRVFLDQPTAMLILADDGQSIDPKYYRVTQLSGNAVPAGGTGSVDYLIQVLGATSVDWSKIDVVTNDLARTDPSILAIVKKQLYDAMDQEKIEDFSVQPYRLTSPVIPLENLSPNRSNPAGTVPIPTNPAYQFDRAN